VGVVRVIIEVYYRKGRKGLQIGSLPGGMEALHVGIKIKKEEDRILF
jgi:hypothetical protein